MISFLDLAKVNNRFRAEIDARFSRILDKGWYLQGNENESFTKHFAEYCFTHGHKKLWGKKFGWRAKFKKIRRMLKAKVGSLIKGER